MQKTQALFGSAKPAKTRLGDGILDFIVGVKVVSSLR
jgi:hypothetical protein